ncbi:hypothetical protein NZL82_01690 [Sphingomonas sanguinis]|uniref:hypothetical protein n=1 Tax=Sphingomonas sp. LC-1 TaxID=3110957 RepID=UPI0021BA7D3D|nr:hypothetical protein [Sphingomonas sp. LC-1]MCT8000584.1 hypothetical protein [Sphingomonas sp. LC-1]
MYQRINTMGATPATADDGAPTAEELIAAYDVPAHRHAAVRRELAAYGRRRDLTGGILGSIKVSASREGGRGLKDRLRRMAGPVGVASLIDSGRAMLVVNEAGVPGALAIGAMLMTASTSRQLDGYDTVSLRCLGQQVIDSCLAGTEEAEVDRDSAHTYATLIDCLLRDGSGDDEDREMLASFEAMTHLASIDHRMAARFLLKVVERVEADGPWVDTAPDTETDIVDRIFLQLELSGLLDQLAADPVVLASINQRREDQRAWRAAKRLADRDAAAALEPSPLLPGLC